MGTGSDEVGEVATPPPGVFYIVLIPLWLPRWIAYRYQNKGVIESGRQELKIWLCQSVTHGMENDVARANHGMGWRAG